MCNFLCIAVLQYTWLCCIVNQHVVQKYLCFLPYFLGWAQWTIPLYERANCYAKCPGCYLKIIICYTLIAFSAYKRSSVYIFCYAKIASWNRSLWLIMQGGMRFLHYGSWLIYDTKLFFKLEKYNLKHKVDFSMALWFGEVFHENCNGFVFSFVFLTRCHFAPNSTETANWTLFSMKVIHAGMVCCNY